MVSSAHELAVAQAHNQTNTSFTVTGQAITLPEIKDLPFAIEANGVCLTFFDRRTERSSTVKPGDFIEVSGNTGIGDDGSTTILNCHQLRVRSAGLLPQPHPVSIREFRTGAFTHKLVSVKGTITDITSDDIDSRFVIIVLSDESETLYLHYSSKESSTNGMIDLLGATVLATGVGYRDFGVRQLAGPSLAISGTNALHVIRHNHSGPFDVPIVENIDLANLHILRSGDVKMIRGTVIARWDTNMLLLQLSQGKTARVELGTSVQPRLGDSIEAIGHLETDLIDLYLSRAFWRRTSTHSFTQQTTRNTTLRELFTNRSGGSMITVHRQGARLRIQGTVKSVWTDERSCRKMLVSEGNSAIIVECTATPKVFKRELEGCRVAISGICIKNGDIWRPNVFLPKIRGIFLVLQSENDVEILQRPSWWTPTRFLLIVGVLLTIIIAVLIWNALLRLMVTRKSRALLKEQAEKLTEQLKVDERTRLAAELHDFHSQSLTAISYQVSAARNSCCNDPVETSHLLSTASQMLKSCRTELRRCLWDLRNDVLNEPDFANAIRKTITPVARSAKTAVRFAGRRTLISDSTAHSVLSILRELTSNAVIHGHAQNVRIAGECLQHALRISVSDDGCGFDPASRLGQNDGHFGIDGIIERLNRIGGSIDIKSSPNAGCYIRITIDHTLPQ